MVDFCELTQFDSEFNPNHVHTQSFWGHRNVLNVLTHTLALSLEHTRTGTRTRTHTHTLYRSRTHTQAALLCWFVIVILLCICRATHRFLNNSRCTLWPDVVRSGIFHTHRSSSSSLPSFLLFLLLLLAALVVAVFVSGVVVLLVRIVKSESRTVRQIIKVYEHQRFLPALCSAVTASTPNLIKLIDPVLLFGTELQVN